MASVCDNRLTVFTFTSWRHKDLYIVKWTGFVRQCCISKVSSYIFFETCCIDAKFKSELSSLNL